MRLSVFSMLSDAASLSTANASAAPRPAALEAYEKRLELLEADKADLMRRCHGG